MMLASWKIEKLRQPQAWLGWVVGAGALSLVAVLATPMLFDFEVGDTLIRHTARLSLVWYWLAALGMLTLPQDEWQATTPRSQIVRWCWTWGAVVFLTHVIVSFHFYHHWSHAKAFDHVAEASNFGPGIFASYFFTLLWMWDVGYWWFFPKRYAKRPLVVGYWIHGFMFFIVLNGSIVFEKGLVRWLGGWIAVTLTVVWLLEWRAGQGRRHRP